MRRWVVVLWLGLSSFAAASDAFLAARGERAVEPPTTGMVTATEPRLGVPTFYWAEPLTRAATPRASGLSSIEAARQHLLASNSLYRSSAARVAAAVVSSVHDTGHGAIIVAFQQRLGGVRVFRDEVHVVMNRDLELVAISGYLTPEIEARGDFSLTATSAVASAWRAMTGSLRDVPSSDAMDDAGFVTWSFSDGFARARPTWFPLVDGVKPGFHVEVEFGAEAHSFVISAVDGDVLFEKNLVAQHSYAVWADPATKVPWPSPLGPRSMPYEPVHSLPVQPQSFVLLDNAGLSTNDPWLAVGASDLRGNNVVAYADLQPGDGFTPGLDVEGRASAPGEFHASFDPLLLPGANDAQTQSSLAHLFYVNNFLHDWFYDSGFDERARNAQLDNFGRGGASSDPLLAEVLDWSGDSNAYMTTPSDGRSPRMTMFPWFDLVTVDGAMDTSVIAHEYGHYISNRLIGDSMGISNHQGFGLGEGWADFHGVLLLATQDDTNVASNSTWGGAFVGGGYSTHNFQFGVRRFPMSTNFAVNPLTFRHIQRGVALPTTAPMQPIPVPNHYAHNTGEVWSVMLWECYVALLRDPRLSFSEAQRRMKGYLVAAYKATPMTPTFIEARDALLSVAAAADLTDYLSFSGAFARRGIGSGASGPARDNPHNVLVVESYRMQGSARLLSMSVHESPGSCDGDGVLDADEDGEVHVEVRNLGLEALAAGDVKVTITATPGDLSFPLGATVDAPALAPSEVARVVVPIRLAHVLGLRALTLTATAAGASLVPPATSMQLPVLLNYDETASSSTNDDFEASVPVWTPGANSALDVTGTFRRTQPTPTQRFWFAPPGESAADVWLTSPPLQVGSGAFSVSFQHRYEFEREGLTFFDGAVVELSADDGQTWVDVGAQATPGYVGVLVAGAQNTNPLAGRRAFAGRSDDWPAFHLETLNLGTAWAGRTVRLRFRVGSDAARRLFSRGWEIDDVRITGLVNTPFPQLTADRNRCTNTAPVAIVGVSFAVDEGQRVVLQPRAFDAERDPLTLSWTQSAGPPGVLNGNVFIAPEVDVDSEVTLTLRAHDGRETSAPAHLRLSVRNLNRVPQVVMPESLNVLPGTQVTLTASARDDEAAPLRFAWAQVSGPPVALSGVDTLSVSFVTPLGDARQVVELQFTASDAFDTSAPGTVFVTVETPPPPPPPVEKRPRRVEPKGCGCSGGGDVLGALALLLSLRRFRSTPARR